MTSQELLALCAEKEAQFVRPGRTNGDRLMAAIPELPEENVGELVKAMVGYAQEKIDRVGPIETALTFMMMGVEMGRELERQVDTHRAAQLRRLVEEGPFNG